MFGSQMMGHDARYRYAAEWIEIVKMLWTREEEFDFEGEFLQDRKGAVEP